MVPQVGDPVLALVDRAINNGSDIAPGVLTRVWSGPNAEQAYLVNAKAFLDSAAADQLLQSVWLYPDEDRARACLEAVPTTRVLFPRSAVIR